MPEAVPYDLPFDEAIAFFRAKGFAFSPESWRDIWQQAHTRAFTVARVTELDVLRDIREEVQKALDSGIGLQQFKKELVPLLQRKGWFTPSGEKAMGILPDGAVRKRLTPWRLENIYRSNLQTAYSVGRYRQQIEVADRRPYWQYKAVLDSRTRVSHATQNNKVYEVRHPFWNRWYPPNGFNCRCYVKTLSADDVRERGLTVETRGTDHQPDEGWRYNPGENFLSWDRVGAPPPVFREAPGQKTYADFGRPDIRDVPDAIRQPTPPVLPRADRIGRGAALDALCDAAGIAPGESFSTIATGDGAFAVLSRERLAHLLDAGDGRERYAGMILPTLTNPFEVYLTEYVDDTGRTVVRKRYIGLFADEKNRNYLVILDQGRDGNVLWNAFTREKYRINKARIGELIYWVPF